MTDDTDEVMLTPADRLRQARIKKGFSTAGDAAQAYGWNEHTYRSHENGNRSLPLSAARKYAAAFGTTPGFLLGVETNTNLSPTFPVSSIPVVARVSAGVFRAVEAFETEDLLVPAAPRRDIPAKLQYSVIVDGTSVNKRIPNGAFAICIPYDSYPGGAQHGQLVHVIRERSGLQEHTIKELRFTSKGMILMPVSDDPRYQEEIKLAVGEEDENVRINGIVIGSYSPL